MTGSVTRASTDQEGQARNLAPASSRSGAARCPPPPTPTSANPSESSRSGSNADHPGRDRERACVPRVTGERSGAQRARARSGEPGGARRRRATGEASRRRAHVRGRAHTSTANHDDTLDDIPNRATRLPLPSRYLTFPTSHRLPARPTPDCLPRPLLPCSSSCSTTSCLPPPRLRPSRYMPGLPSRFIWQVEEGGSSAKRWTPLPRKPRRDAGSRPEAGRRPVDL